MKDRRVSSCEKEDGEWWVELKPGYRLKAYGVQPGGEQHCFGELTTADVRQTMKEVEPCDCADCKKAMSQ